MPLASLFALQFYGPAMASAVIEGSGSVTAQAKGYLRAGATIEGTGSITNARPVKLISAYSSIVGTGSITTAQARGLLRCLATIKVNELSQDDVTGAVFSRQIDGKSFEELLRLMSAVLLGKVDITGDVNTFRDIADTKDRVTATVNSQGERTDVDYDAS